MSDTQPVLEVNMDPTPHVYGVFLAYTPEEDDHVALRSVIEEMIERGELAKAHYDVGARGALAFKLGSLGTTDRYNKLDNLGDACFLLQEGLQRELASRLTAA